MLKDIQVTPGYTIEKDCSRGQMTLLNLSWGTNCSICRVERMDWMELRMIAVVF